MPSKLFGFKRFFSCGTLTALATVAVVLTACTDSVTEPQSNKLSSDVKAMGDELQPVVVDGCRYGGEYPNCNPAPHDPPNPPGSGGDDPGTQPGGSGGGDSPPEPPPPSASDAEGPTGKPNCSSATLWAMQRAWCAGRRPTADESSKINAALQRMNAKGGVCSALAALGAGYLASGDLHIINDQVPYWDDYEQRNVWMGGAAPRGGGDFSYISIGSTFLAAYDAAHMTNEGAESRTLQQILAHELDHLHDSNHLLNPDGSTYNLYRTDNSQHCSDLPGQ